VALFHFPPLSVGPNPYVRPQTSVAPRLRFDRLPPRTGGNRPSRDRRENVLAIHCPRAAANPCVFQLPALCVSGASQSVDLAADCAYARSSAVRRLRIGVEAGALTSGNTRKNRLRCSRAARRRLAAALYFMGGAPSASSRGRSLLRALH